MLLPQGVSRRLGQIAKIDPLVATWRTGKIFPPDLLAFLRQLGVDAVWVECVRIYPLDLGSFWIDLKTGFLTSREPNFPLVVCHNGSHLLFGLLLISSIAPQSVPLTGPGLVGPGAAANSDFDVSVTVADFNACTLMR
jgi:hypothetical protein